MGVATSGCCAGGLPTDRPDRPEWLFATALKAAQQCCPLAQELQPCVGEPASFFSREEIQAADQLALRAESWGDRRRCCHGPAGVLLPAPPAVCRRPGWCCTAQPETCSGPALCRPVPAAEAHQLQAWYSLPLELARAIQAVGVNAIVADHLLPQVGPASAACHQSTAMSLPAALGDIVTELPGCLP